MKSFLFFLLAAFVVVACAKAPEPGDPGVIQSRSDAWEDALNAGDIDTVVDLYAEDARVMPPNGPTMSGHDAVRASFAPMIEDGLTVDLTSVESQVTGDTGYNVGTYVIKAGDDVIDTGKFVEIWKRGADGKWRYSNDIWNSDAPAVAESEAEPVTEVLITHEVKDGDHWLDAWRGEEGRRQLFLANGAKYVHTFRSADDPNLTGLVVGVADMDALNAMLASDEGAAAAAADGVDLDNMTMLMETN